MNRNTQYSALVLRVHPSGESNREAFFLTAEEGVIRATLYGGPKSRLRSHVAPYHRGLLWAYRDPAKDSRKVNDFDVQSWRPGLRELYERAAAAAVVAETIVSGHGGGGNWEAALGLADQCLDALETAGGLDCSYILLKFLWRWFDILGIRPDLGCCASCGREFAAKENGFPPDACPPSSDGVLLYSGYEGGFVCGPCRENSAKKENGYIRVNSGARRWLKNAEAVSFREPARYALDDASLGQAAALMGALLYGACGTTPVAWKEWNKTAWFHQPQAAERIAGLS